MIWLAPTVTMSPIGRKSSVWSRSRYSMQVTPATPGTAWIAASSALRCSGWPKTKRLTAKKAFAAPGPVGDSAAVTACFTCAAKAFG